MKIRKVTLVGNLTSHIMKAIEEMKKIEKNGKKDLDNSK
tara:strand:- start:535 stop:651 length:117 start_codon:yes stop_codon:yes gene_type:complete